MVNKKLLDPINLFILSSVIFVLNRPLMHFLFDVPMVFSGTQTVEAMYHKPIIFTFLFVLITVASAQRTSRIDWLPLSRCLPLRPDIAKILKVFLTIPLLICATAFLAISLNKNGLVNGNYLKLAHETGLHSHLWLGFLSIKLSFFFLWFGPTVSNLKYILFVLLLTSIGFLLVYLRGYFIFQFVLLLYFFQFTVPNFRLLSVFAIFFVSILFVFLGYHRMGLEFKVFEFYDIFREMLVTQSATFEQVYGAANYREAFWACNKESVLYINSMCIDQSRGVNFEYGGYGTSIFAEALLYFNWFGLLLAVPLGACIGYLQRHHLILAENFEEGVKSGRFLILFLMVPNLVSIGRGNLFDFFWSSIVALIFCFVIVRIIKFVQGTLYAT